MASGKQKSKKKNQQNDYVGGGVFSINKARTSIWTKVILVLLALAMIIGTGTGIYQLFFNAGQKASSTTPEGVDATYQTQVDQIQTQIDANPKDAQLYVNLANTYFDWANSLQQTSDSSQESLTKIAGVWDKAKAAYKQALELDSNLESGVKIDYSLAMFYSGDTEGAIKEATAVTEKDPSFAMAWLSLGQSFEAQGDTEKAKSAYNKYVELDPSNTQNVQYVQQRLESLDSGASN